MGFVATKRIPEMSGGRCGVVDAAAWCWTASDDVARFEKLGELGMWGAPCAVVFRGRSAWRLKRSWLCGSVVYMIARFGLLEIICYASWSEGMS